MLTIPLLASIAATLPLGRYSSESVHLLPRKTSRDDAVAGVAKAASSTLQQDNNGNRAAPRVATLVLREAL